MLLGTVHGKLVKLNPKLRLIAMADDSKPVGLYLVDDCSIEHLCGVDRGDVPEYTTYDKFGHIVKAGWRRTLNILVQRKLVNRSKAERLFSVRLNSRGSSAPKYKSDIDRAIEYYESHSTKNGDDLVDISRMIKKEKGIC